MFVHQSAEFPDLLRIVAEASALPPGLVEKDYWVTHTLWALHDQGLEVWFKGGTSLSKGFQIIERFSEDLDLKIEPGRVPGLEAVENWKSEAIGPVRRREGYFHALVERLQVPNCQVQFAPERDSTWRSANYRVLYSASHRESLPGVIRPYVLLEVGSARVTPSIDRPLSSFVHDWLERHQPGEWSDNRPRAVRCVHPLVTLLEKLDGITRRYPREDLDAASFARHYEDAARIIQRLGDLPAPPMDVASLAAEMLAMKQVRQYPDAHDPAFVLAESTRKEALYQAWEALQPMFWGDRIPLETCCKAIRSWLADTLGEAP